MAELRLSGLCFSVGPDAALSPRERATLAALDAGGTERAWDAGDPRAWPIEVVDAPFTPPADGPLEPAPAAVRFCDGFLAVSHASFEAQLDAVGGSGRLWRREADGSALFITLRVALAALLPLHGGLPLHAAGVVLDGQGCCFFGPSGAGKSTLAASAAAHGLHVFSDEQVSLLGAPWRLGASGFWGALDGSAPRGAAPLMALFELGRAPTLRVERLDPRRALRRLLEVLLVPPQPALWSRALAAAGRLVHDVPVWRLAWNPDDPPWDGLRARLAAEGALAETVTRA